MNNKAVERYLGDGVYAEYVDCQIILTTRDGYAIRNRIYLEPEVWVALKMFMGEQKTE